MSPVPVSSEVHDSLTPAVRVAVDALLILFNALFGKLQFRVRNVCSAEYFSPIRNKRSTVE